MKYMIVHMLRGEIGHYVKCLGDELADVFSVESASSRIPPHLTLKVPFEASDNSLIYLENILSAFARTHVPGNITIDGFGNFNRRVLFAHVELSPEVRRLVADLERELRRCSWMSFSRTDGDKRAHATFAYAEQKPLFDEMARYIKGEERKIDGVFDSISLLRLEKERWILHREYDLARPA